MKWQNFKAPLVVSGIFLFTVFTAGMAMLFQPLLPGVARFMPTRERIIILQNTPLRGHWLMTEKDKAYNPPALIIKKNRSSGEYGAAHVLTMEEAKSRLNRLTDTVNVMYIWTDQDRLRVISITGFNKTTRQACVVVVPLYTVTDGINAELDKDHKTVQDLYQAEGREGVRGYFEQKFEIKIPNFVHVNQTALEKISDIVGVLKVNGDEITMLEAFEQTEAGQRTDDRDVVRAVATQILRPRMILEVPKLLRIFTYDIKTNFTAEQMVTLFHLSRQMDLGHMRKTALPGYEHVKSGNKYLFVSDQTWKNLIYEITQ